MPPPGLRPGSMMNTVLWERGRLTAALFAVAFLVSAGVLAVWIDLRLPRLAPAEYPPALLHLLIASVANQLLDARAGSYVAGLSIPGSRVVAIVGVILPLVVYAALAALWTLKLAQRSLSGRVG
jgi:hypothetical protein